MTVINGLPISDQLADAILGLCPQEGLSPEDTTLGNYCDVLSRAQDFICMQLDKTDTELSVKADLIQSLVQMRHELNDFERKLPKLCDKN